MRSRDNHPPLFHITTQNDTRWVCSTLSLSPSTIIWKEPSLSKN
nr:MAG TPA: hypothetical protein [Caudoviricetes sp.]